MKYISIDYGSKKSGIAVANCKNGLAFPREVVPTAELYEYIANLIAEDGITVIVMGDSQDYKGNENTIMKPARRFAEKISSSHPGVSIVYQDERLTTKQAANSPLEQVSRGNVARSNAGGIRKNVDAQSAAIILQSYLDQNCGKID